MVVPDTALKAYQVLISGANDPGWSPGGSRAGRYNPGLARIAGFRMSAKRARSLGRCGLGVALALASWMALRPVSEPEWFSGQDKVLHLAAYAGFYLLGRLGFPEPGWRLPGALFGYGLIIEGLQSLVPGRVPSGLDLAANALGLALGVLLVRGLLRRNPSLPRAGGAGG